MAHRKLGPGSYANLVPSWKVIQIVTDYIVVNYMPCMGHVRSRALGTGPMCPSGVFSFTCSGLDKARIKFQQ